MGACGLHCMEMFSKGPDGLLLAYIALVYTSHKTRNYTADATILLAAFAKILVVATLAVILAFFWNFHYNAVNLQGHFTLATETLIMISAPASK